MKNAKLFTLKTIAVICAVAMLSSCTGPDIADIPDVTINNGNFEGIILGNTTTAQTALPIPDGSGITPPEDTSVSENTESTSDTSVSPEASDNPSSSATTTPPTSEITTTTTTPSASTTTTTTTTQTTTTTTATTTQTTVPPATGSDYGINSYSALNYNHVQAVWISYIEINNLLKNKSKDSFKTALGEIYDNCRSMGINTVYVHTRAFGDAFYYSELYPFTKYLSGSLGTSLNYDPLKIMIEEAHSRGLSFHAWINPLRLCSSSDMPYVSEKYKIGEWYGNSKNGKYIVEVNGTWYLNPAYDEAIKLVGDGVREIVSKYNVDGVHIDDYFYPTTAASFDSSAYAESGYSTISAFRINNCNKLVKEIYNAVNDCSKTAIFGASTQGSIVNNITQLYADAESWCSGGYIDYFAPQVYYGFENSAQPFKQCVDEWNTIVNGTKTDLYIGLALYKIGEVDTWAGTGKNEWVNTSTMIKRQIEYCESVKNCNGVVLYSYNYLFEDGYYNSKIQKEIDNFKPLLIG